MDKSDHTNIISQMKKFLLLISVSIIFFGIGAVEYPYMLIMQKDGTKKTFDAIGLGFAVSDGNLSVISSEAEVSLRLSDLDYMAFTSDISQVSDIIADDCEIEVFNTGGVFLGHFDTLSQARAAIGATGVYIVKSKDRTLKIALSK